MIKKQAIITKIQIESHYFFELTTFLGFSIINMFFTLLTNKNYDLNQNIEFDNNQVNIWFNLFNFCSNQTLII